MLKRTIRHDNNTNITLRGRRSPVSYSTPKKNVSIYENLIKIKKN